MKIVADWPSNGGGEFRLCEVLVKRLLKNLLKLHATSVQIWAVKDFKQLPNRAMQLPSSTFWLKKWTARSTSGLHYAGRLQSPGKALIFSRAL